MRELALSEVYRLLEPGPVVLLTTSRAGRDNVMAMSWHMMVEFTPPLVACVVSDADYSFAALRANTRMRYRRPGGESGENGRCDRQLLGPNDGQVRCVWIDAGPGPPRRRPAGGRVSRQSRMRGRRHAIRQTLRPVHPRGRAGLARPDATERQDDPPSRSRRIRRRRRDDQARFANAIIAVARSEIAALAAPR